MVKHQCIICNKTFSQKCHLDYHMKRKLPCKPVEIEPMDKVIDYLGKLDTNMKLISERLDLLETKGINIRETNDTQDTTDLVSVSDSSDTDDDYAGELKELLNATKSFVEFDNTEIWSSPENRVRTMLGIVSGFLRRDIPLTKVNSSMREYRSLDDISPFT